MSVRRLTAGTLFLAAAVVATDAGAAELKVLSVEAMRPALQELAKEFEAASKDTLKIDYAAAKIAGGSIKVLAKQSPDLSYDASTTHWTRQPFADKALIDFLGGPKAAEVYKAKGMQPG